MITQDEYLLLNHVFVFDRKTRSAVERDCGKNLLKACLSKNLVSRNQDYEQYCWDGEERISITSAGILEMNLYEKSNVTRKN